MDTQPNAGAQLDGMKKRLTDALLRGRQLEVEKRAIDEQIDALTNFLAGAEIGARNIVERAKAQAEAAKAAPAGQAMVDGQSIELIDETAGKA